VRKRNLQFWRAIKVYDQPNFQWKRGKTGTQPFFRFSLVFWSTASGHGLGLRSHSLVYQYDLRAWIGITVTQPGFRVRPQGMDWDYGHAAWFNRTASGHGLGLRSHSLVLEHGLTAWIKIYGHTAWVSSTASGHGLGLQ